MPYGLAIFTGAFLLFQIQPMIAKYILPWFGGIPAVWTTTLLFFQLFLLFGYLYAHWLTRSLRGRTQVKVHLAALTVAVLTLPTIPAARWRPESVTVPSLRILGLLAITVGLPYLVLAATSPLLQAWFARAEPDRSPYRLYALSNLGSMLGLLTYPFLVEPNLTRNAQAYLWAVGFVGFLLATAWVGARTARTASHGSARRAADVLERPSPPPGRWTRSLWIALSATAVVLLLAVTAHLTQDVAPIPFLWVIPLSVYLLSFVIAFDHPRWYARRVFAPLMVFSFALTGWLMFVGSDAWLQLSIGGYAATLFVFCMVCHGELYDLRPEARHLTSFYLHIAVGGVLGGVAVNFVAPAVFVDYYELHFGLLAVGLLGVGLWMTRAASARRSGHLIRVTASAGGVLALALLLWLHARDGAFSAVERSRNFYGALAVGVDDPGTRSAVRWIRHGTIIHGIQSLLDPKEPASYYSRDSGLGLAFAELLKDEPRKIGVVGLGAGVVAAFGQAGDSLRFYEINPEMVRIAQERFTYLSGSAAHTEVVLGDARSSLEREADQGFDLLVLDAYSGDGIPLHLLTLEAFRTYVRHLDSDGVIAAHLSSAYFDLEPVVRRLGEVVGLRSAFIEVETEGYLEYPSSWLIMSSDPAKLEADRIAEAATEPLPGRPAAELWTDDFASPLLALHR